MKRLITLAVVAILALTGCKTAENTDSRGSTEQTHWVNHIHDDTIFNPTGTQNTWGTIPWINIHGFEEAGGIYWVGADSRCWGIRMSDMVIRCKNKATYDKYIKIAEDGGSALLRTAERDSTFNMRRGDKVNTEFIFKWGNDDKSFDVRLKGDFYAEEK